MLHRTLRSWLAAVSLLLLCLGALPAVADNQQGYCAPPVSSCGCVSCGCPAPSEPPLPSCPPGKVTYGDYCLPACPPGWNRYPGYPGVCLPPCHQGCPEGYEQIPLPYCPEGYHRDLSNPNYCQPDFPSSSWSRSESVDQSYDEGDCPPGLVRSASTLECVVDCPQGSYIDDNGLCRSYYQDNCQPGLQHDPETGRCVPPGNWPRGYEWICLPQCPQGYVRDIEQPTRCMPPPGECREGYERIADNRCVPVCEPGTQRDPYGYCVPQSCPDDQYSNLPGRCQEPECLPGYDRYQGTCLPSCQTGYSRGQDGTCVPPFQGCPEGTLTFDGQCMPDCQPGYVQDPVTGACSPETRGCEPGTELVRGQCVPLCETGSLRNNAGLCVPTGCPTGEEKVNGTCLPRCAPPLVRDAKNRCVCPQGTENVNGKCQPLCREGMVRSASGQCTCPSGLEFLGGQCVPQCKKGLVRDGKGNCVEPACPDGQENFRGRCVKMCPQGFVRNKKGKCVCPKGTEIGASGYCQPVQAGCPEGQSYSKRYKTCLPDKAPEPAEPSPAQPQQQPDLTLPDKLQLIDPGSLMQLLPSDGNDAAADCPDGYVRNKKGRCVKGQ